MANSIVTLNKTKNNPNNEIYTHIEEVIKELGHYKEEFKDKIIYCNCDDEKSAFYQYFMVNFNILELKKLYCTSINDNGIKITYNGSEIKKENLQSNGSYNSNECIELLDECDIVVTNPPFSMIHDFIDLLVEHQKKYIIIGPVTVFQARHLQHVIDGELGYGYKDSNKERMKYSNIDKTYGNHCWLTNLQGDGKKEKKIIKKEYDMSTYPKFDNSDILYIDRGDRIPYKYNGIIAISKTFIVGMYNPYDKLLHIETPIGEVKYKVIDFGKNLKINNVNVYDRILIQKV